MEKVNEISKELRSGDAAEIAEVVGVHHDYVRKVMRGDRFSPVIMEAAKLLIARRNAWKREVQSLNLAN